MAKPSRIMVRQIKALAELTEQVEALRVEVAEIKALLGGAPAVREEIGHIPKEFELTDTLEIIPKPKPRRPRSPQGKKE